jgi:hypothetical protein
MSWDCCARRSPAERTIKRRRIKNHELWWTRIGDTKFDVLVIKRFHPGHPATSASKKRLLKVPVEVPNHCKQQRMKYKILNRGIAIIATNARIAHNLERNTRWMLLLTSSSANSFLASGIPSKTETRNDF